MSDLGIRRGDRVLLLERGVPRERVHDGLVMAVSMDQALLGRNGEPSIGVVSVVPEDEACGVDVHIRRGVVHFTHRAWLDGSAAVAYEELPNPVPGVCRYCGCTERRACSPPCAWSDVEQTVCTAEKCVHAFHVDFYKAIEDAEGED